nr:hypothetical protein [Bacteroidota bacterium]
MNSIANGIYAGKEIKKVFDRNDFSKESLSKVSGFINKDTEMFANQIAKMASWVTEMDEQTMLTYFRIFHKINYPTMFYGTKKQIMMMMMGIMLRNIFKILRNPKMFKYM